MKAAKKYRKESNAKFSTYAYKYILGEILEFIRNDRNIKVSSEELKLYKAYQKGKEFLSQKMNREPSFKEISLFLEISESDLYQCLSNCEFTLSLDEKIDEEKDYYEVIGFDEISDKEDLIMLRNEIEKLNEFDRKILNLRIYKDYTQNETAKVLGITQVQVSRYENNIYSKIKNNMKVN